MHREAVALRADTARMNAFDTEDPYGTAIVVLAKLAFDLRTAIAMADDADSRGYAFSLVHLHRALTNALGQGVWSSPEKAGRQALDLIHQRYLRDPQGLPDWLIVLARQWASTALPHRAP